MLESPIFNDLPGFDVPRPRSRECQVKTDINIQLSRARRDYRKAVLALRPRCAYCGSGVKLDDSTLDHLRPKCRGGEDRPSNLVLACRNCNEAKGDRTPLRWAWSIVLAAGRHRLAAMIRG